MAKAGSAEVSLTPKRREIHSPFFKFHRLTLFFKNAPSSSEKWQECVIHILVQIYFLFLSIYGTFFCFFPLNSLKFQEKTQNGRVPERKGKGRQSSRRTLMLPKSPLPPISYISRTANSCMSIKTKVAFKFYPKIINYFCGFAQKRPPDHRHHEVDRQRMERATQRKTTGFL